MYYHTVDDMEVNILLLLAGSLCGNSLLTCKLIFCRLISEG